MSCIIFKKKVNIELKYDGKIIMFNYNKMIFNYL